MYQVTPEEWAGLKQKLSETYGRIFNLLQGVEDWANENTIGGSLAIVVHTAYHLGEIR